MLKLKKMTVKSLDESCTLQREQQTLAEEEEEKRRKGVLLPLKMDRC